MSFQPKDFAAALRRFEAQLDREALDMTRRAARSALEVLVRGTPVASGQARANWQVSLDRPALGTLDVTDSNGAATIAAGFATIAGAETGQPIHIVNNLSYIARLNDGDSSGSGSAFVERALQSARAAAKRAASRSGGGSG